MFKCKTNIITLATNTNVDNCGSFMDKSRIEIGNLIKRVYVFHIKVSGFRSRGVRTFLFNIMLLLSEWFLIISYPIVLL